VTSNIVIVFCVVSLRPPPSAKGYRPMTMTDWLLQHCVQSATVKYMEREARLCSTSFKGGTQTEKKKKFQTTSFMQREYSCMKPNFVTPL